MKTAERYVDVPGGKVYVKTWTPENLLSQVPLVLLHDSLGSTEMWRAFPELLAKVSSRRVISYDRLGFGRSSQRKVLPSIRFVKEEGEVYLPLIFKALNIEEFILFGHSVGGGMALCAAEVFGSRCLAVVTESAQAFVEDRTRDGINQARIDFANSNVFAKLEKYHGEKTQWVLDAWIKVWLSAEFSNWSLAADLPKVKCPVLVIHGDRDEYGSSRFPDLIADLVRGRVEKKIIKDCGHVPHREKVDTVLELVTSFFLIRNSLSFPDRGRF